MSRFEVCHTHDLEEARRCGERIFCENRLRNLDTKGAINARFYYRGLEGIGVGRLGFGGDVTIEPGTVLDSFYLIQMPIRGQERIECGDQRVLSTSNMGSILNAHVPFRINHSNGTEKLIMRVDRSLLERHCQQHLGRTLRKGIEFQAGMPLDTEQGRLWMRMVGWLYDSLSANDEHLPPLLYAQFEQTVVTMLLTCQPHNYSAELCADGPSIAPSFVKRVERYIEEHAHEPISIVDMAEHAGVSSRSLFTGFRRFRNTSPMLYLKEVRLRYVQEELQRQSFGATTVTAVAFHWGFSHLGHFTTDYKRRFGESPSETLAR
ncbi:AraC family transcriptional regulator [Pseudomonas cavernicola]|uniref:AraC family transcriptional regulator n=1 Tax=Pseudomonas cavernicola TaxID=2320866 RepID=UPI001EE634FF|nr:AraC family transcriptional regulator [Pseudomonas cavernicola]